MMSSMGSGHSHRAGADIDAALTVARLPRTALMATLGLAAIATVVGLFALWPDSGEADKLVASVSFAAPGVTFPDAVVSQVQPVCKVSDTGAPDASGQGCGQLVVSVTTGAGRGDKARVQVAPQVAASGLAAGDEVRLMRIPATDGQPATYSYFGTERSGTLWLLVIAFVLLVLAVARLRGLMALTGLAVSGLVIWKFVLPALLVGEPGLLVGLTAAAAIMFVVLYTTHGLSLRTSAALAGTLGGLGITALIGLLAISSTHLTGVSDESGGVLSSYAGDLDFQGLLTCAIVIAGLGVLNDVTITQASAVWELRGASPGMSRGRLVASAMRIGRDHIASTIYTIAFAYAGTALVVLLILQLYDLPIVDLLATEDITGEIVRTLASSIGLVLAVPLTTAIAAVTVPGPTDPTSH
ncbi:MAG: YibE/F family protein [Nocardioides sp.]|nr:YibE/F family protein [Nocardioides sp.]